MPKTKTFLQSRPAFVFLLPLFFVSHGYVQNYPLVPPSDVLKLVFEYLAVTLLLTTLFYFIFQSWQKALLFAFFLMCVQFFFGAVHDLLKNWFPGWFIPKYSFLLPLILAIVVATFLLILKTTSHFKRLTQYISITLVLLIAIDLVFLCSKLLSTTKTNAFGSPNTGPVGQAYDGRVEYYSSSDREVNPQQPVTITADTKLPRVDIVYMYADAPSDMIDMLIAKKVDGIVIAGVGNGNFNKAYMEAVKRAVAAGIIVCRASRTPSGRVVLHDEINDEELGTIVSDDLTPQKARILLILGLTKTKDKKQLQDLFFKY